jgi:hypothetical protein
LSFRGFGPHAAPHPSGRQRESLLVRFAGGSLLRLDADAHVLLLCMHHIVSDGWSAGVPFRELSLSYAVLLMEPIRRCRI